MPKVVFKNQTGNAPELFPINIFDKIPENHPVRLVNYVVDQLDITEVLAKYKGGGTSAYHPRMMIKVLFYSYLSNTYSCRKIAKALTENIHFMFISGNSTPDFRTINEFRGKTLKDTIKSLFAQVVEMLLELQYISLDVQYIDGTKIESAAGRYTFVWRANVERRKDVLETRIKGVLADIDSHILSDNQDINKEELPKKIDSEELKEKLSQIKSKTQQDLPKKVAREIKKLQEEHLPQLEKCEKNLEILKDRNSFSKTDPDATFMRLKDDHLQSGQLKPSYNVQISTEEQFITHASIHQTAGDTTTLESHLEGFEQAYNKQSKVVVADAGYGSEENYEMLEKKKIKAFVKYNQFYQEQKNKVKNNPFLVQNLYYNQEQDFYVCPMGQRMENIGEGKRTSKNGYESQVTHYQAKRCEGCPLRGMCHNAKENRIIEVNHRLNELRQRAKDNLMSEEGIYHRKKRSVEVEAVFGQLKSNNKFERFTMRGLVKVELELLLMALGHNFRKMVAKATFSKKLGAKMRQLLSIFDLYQVYILAEINFLPITLSKSKNDEEKIFVLKIFA